VAAREDEPESIVLDRHGVPCLSLSRFDGRQLLLDELFPAQLLGLRDEPAGPAQPIDGPVAGRRRDPRPRVRRHAVAGPALERRDERVLDCLLGEIEVADRPDEGRVDPARLLAEQALDGLDASGVRRDGVSSQLSQPSAWAPVP
jgi:hypothetical protein